MSTPALVVAAAILDRLDVPRALLAARRSAPPSLAGRWEFPGGKVEAGETALAALDREIEEELGVRLRVGEELVGPDDGAWRLDEQYVMRLWLAEVADGVPKPRADHDRLVWLGSGDWFSVPWLDADLRMVEALVAALA